MTLLYLSCVSCCFFFYICSGVKIWKKDRIKLPLTVFWQYSNPLLYDVIQLQRSAYCKQSKAILDCTGKYYLQYLNLTGLTPLSAHGQIEVLRSCVIKVRIRNSTPVGVLSSCVNIIYSRKKLRGEARDLTHTLYCLSIFIATVIY